MQDNLGDRMKLYESAETGRTFMPLLPVYARIDGRCFTRFTKGMERPYDAELSRAMIETVKALVEDTHARIGYTQSDEISLVWLADKPDSEMFFGGKVQKITSVLAALATAHFTAQIAKSPRLAKYLARAPHFDCRAFQLPNKAEAANALLWRELDATKNAITMAAHHYYGHSALLGKSSSIKQEMLFTKGVNFNDYPAFFKRGTFVRRETTERALTAEELARIPENHRPLPDATFCRSAVVEIDMPRFMSVTNREEVVFDGQAPVVAPLTPAASTPPKPSQA